MSVTIYTPRTDWSKREILKSKEGKGRPWNRVAGGWMADITAQRQFVILCPFCVSKFNPRKNHYEVWRQHYQVVGKCDACNQRSDQACGYIHESTHDQVGDDRRRRGRWARTR